MIFDSLDLKMPTFDWIFPYSTLQLFNTTKKSLKIIYKQIVLPVILLFNFTDFFSIYLGMRWRPLDNVLIYLNYKYYYGTGATVTRMSYRWISSNQSDGRTRAENCTWRTSTAKDIQRASAVFVAAYRIVGDGWFQNARRVWIRELTPSSEDSRGMPSRSLEGQSSTYK